MSLATSPPFDLVPVDEIDAGEEAAARSGADAASRDADRQMGFARAGSAAQDDIALAGDEGPAGELAHQVFIDRCVLEAEVFDILGEWQLGDRELVSDRSRRLSEISALKHHSGKITSRERVKPNTDVYKR